MGVIFTGFCLQMVRETVKDEAVITLIQMFLKN